MPCKSDTSIWDKERTKTDGKTEAGNSSQGFSGLHRPARSGCGPCSVFPLQSGRRPVPGKGLPTCSQH